MQRQLSGKQQLHGQHCVFYRVVRGHHHDAGIVAAAVAAAPAIATTRCDGQPAASASTVNDCQSTANGQHACWQHACWTQHVFSAWRGTRRCCHRRGCLSLACAVIVIAILYVCGINAKRKLQLRCSLLASRLIQ